MSSVQSLCVLLPDMALRSVFLTSSGDKLSDVLKINPAKHLMHERSSSYRKRTQVGSTCSVAGWEVEALEVVSVVGC